MSRRHSGKRVTAVYPPPNKNLDKPLADYGASAINRLSDMCLVMPSTQLAAICDECDEVAGLELACRRHHRMIATAIRAGFEAIVRMRARVATGQEVIQ